MGNDQDLIRQTAELKARAIRLERRLHEADDLIRELAAKVEAAENGVCEQMAMVPLYTQLPHGIYQRLRERADELGRPATELASLLLWKRIQEGW